MARPRKGDISPNAMKPKQFWMTSGTPNQQSEPKGYVLEGDLRKGVAAVFDGLMPLARRQGLDAENRVFAAKSEISNMPVHNERRFIDCVVDPETGTVCRVYFWKGTS